MPMSVDEQHGEIRHGVIQMTSAPEDTIEVDFYPERVSGKILKSLVHMGTLLDGDSQNALEISKACDEAAEFVVKIVTKWDLLLTRNPPTPCPLELDVVSDFGLAFLFRVLKGLVALVNMGEQRGTPSLKRSRRTASSRSRSSLRR